MRAPRVALYAADISHRPFHAVTGIMTCRMLIHLRKALVLRTVASTETPSTAFDQSRSWRAAAHSGMNSSGDEELAFPLTPLGPSSFEPGTDDPFPGPAKLEGGLTFR